MLFSIRNLVKHWVIDLFLSALAVAFYYAIAAGIYIAFPAVRGQATLGDFYYLFFALFILLSIVRSLVLVLNVAQVIIYHRCVAQSKIGTSAKRYLENPKKSQAIELLKDVLFSLDWVSFNWVNKYLHKVSDGSVSIKIDDKTNGLRDRFLRPAPEICLKVNNSTVDRISLWK